MQSIALNFTWTSNAKEINFCRLQNISERKILDILKNKEIGSWIFRFDYISQKYFLTIKSNNNEYIDHHVSYYCKRTDEVIIQTSTSTSEIFTTLEEYLKEMTKIYNFSLSQQIIV
jgi:serine kinase of HPr protein (carbohydrate metabolism regulator)